MVLGLGTQALGAHLSMDSRLTMNSCAILDPLLDLSESQFPHRENGVCYKTHVTELL